MNLYSLPDEDRESLLLLVTCFYLNYHKPKKYLRVYSEVLKVVGSRSEKEVWTLITNTARALKIGAAGLSIPKTTTAYANNDRGISYRKMKIVLDRLTEQGYLLYLKGGVTKWCAEKETIQSVYLFTDSYLKLWNGIDLSKEIAVLKDSVVVRDRATKKEKSTKGMTGIAEITKGVDAYNELLSETKICVDGVALPTQQYFRCFIDDIRHGGRWFCSGGGIQTMKKELRQLITINDEETCELDFASLHASIILSDIYKEDPDLVTPFIGKDLYAANSNVSEFVKVDKDKVEYYRAKYNKSDHDPVRNMIKQAVVIVLNAKNLVSASGALVGKWRDDLQKEEKDQKFYGLVPYKKKSNGLLDFSGLNFIRGVLEYMYPLQEYAGKDLGVKLMFIESQMISYVLDVLRSEGEIALSEHDSLVVPVRIKQHTKELMREAYSNIVGNDVFCVIKEK